MAAYGENPMATVTTASARSSFHRHETRNRRIAEYVAKHPPEIATRPLWSSPRFEAVLAPAEAVGQRVVLEELLAAGDRVGLYDRHTRSASCSPRRLTGRGCSS